jgi:hypothetical protein
MAERHGMTAAAITGSTRIRLYPLHMRLDGDEWCVGRIEGGRFVALPPIAVEALRCVDGERTVGQVADRLRQAHGRDVDVAEFAGNLLRWHLVRRVRRVASTDPSADLPVPERRVVRAYTTLLGVGTVLCVGFAVAVSVPVGVTALVRATDRLLGGAGPVGVLDGAIALLLAATVWTIWVRAWWRRHGPRVTAWLTRRRSRTREVMHGNH